MIQLVGLVVIIFLGIIVLIVAGKNFEKKDKKHSDKLFNSSSTNSYTKVHEIFETIKRKNIKIDFLGDRK